MKFTFCKFKFKTNINTTKFSVTAKKSFFKIDLFIPVNVLYLSNTESHFNIYFITTLITDTIAEANMVRIVFQK